MVLKFGKRGVRSGNTLKTPSVRALRTYRKNAYVMRSETTATSDEDLTGEKFGVDDIQTPSIPYSLNKKGRWLLPTKMMNAIKQGEFHFEEYGVQLIEMHNINKKANCVSAYFSNGPVKQATVFKRDKKRRKRRSGYMSIKSLRHTNTVPKHRPIRRNKRGVGQQVPPVTEDTCIRAPVDNQVTFEVMYPSPQSSSLTHNPKYIGLDNAKTKQRSKHQKLRRANQDIIQFDVTSLDTHSELSDDEDSSDIAHRLFDKPNGTIDFQEYLTQAISTKQTKRKRSAESLDSYMIVPDFEDFQFVEADDQPVRVILQHKDTELNTLSTRYGHQYVECGCFPRKFIIDISDDVQALPVFTEDWKASIKPVHACVVFVYDVDNEINTTQDGVYKVYLNTSLTDDMLNTKIETIFEYTETNVAECLSRCLFYVETFPNLVQPQDSQHVCSKPSNVNSLLEWENESYIPNDAFHYNSLISSCQINNDHDVLCAGENDLFPTGQLDVATPRGQICAICFDDIRAGVPGTALVTCGHWFCDACWSDYLTSRAQSGCAHIACPEFSCKKPVDKATMMSLLSLENVLKLTKMAHDLSVVQRDEKKWCPNSKCGRVLHVNESDASMVRCECGQGICFQCLGPAHWPASCQAARRYVDVKHELGMADGQFDVSTVSVNGMACPHCKQFFEKIEGCPYMECICGKSFCWGCGRDWITRTHTYRCYDVGEQIVNSRTSRRFAFGVDLENEWVNYALQHRMNQLPIKVATLKRQSLELRPKLTLYLNTTHHHIPLGFKGSKRGYTKESQKIPEFLDNLIDMNTELHFIAENVAVLLSSEESSPQNSYYKNVYSNVNAKCKAIEECIEENGYSFDAKTLMRRLKYAHSSSKRLIKSAVHHMKSLKHIQKVNVS